MPQLRGNKRFDRFSTMEEAVAFSSGLKLLDVKSQIKYLGTREKVMLSMDGLPMVTEEGPVLSDCDYGVVYKSDKSLIEAVLERIEDISVELTYCIRP